MTKSLMEYTDLLSDIKVRVQHTQTKAMLSANRQMLELYWDVGRLIHDQQQHEGWGTSVISRLAANLKNELPEVKGFFESNLGRMICYYSAYPTLGANSPQPVAKLTTPAKVPQAVAQFDEEIEAELGKPDEPPTFEESP